MAKIGIFVGSVYGGAEDVAHAVASYLNDEGHDAAVFDIPTSEEFLSYQDETVLVITSTTGQGEIPDNALPMYLALEDTLPQVPTLRFGVVAMGDSSYGEERYCGAGRQFESLLLQLQARPVAPRLDVDACVNFDALDVVMPWVQTWAAS
ncbi:flavodoxin [Photobacterium japonica]|uniref:flavodoxin n=1 Tax=Photobacterium japonica TaxID=2910235 RepID=UPI003D0BCED0